MIDNLAWELTICVVSFAVAVQILVDWLRYRDLDNRVKSLEVKTK